VSFTVKFHVKFHKSSKHFRPKFTDEIYREIHELS